MIDLIQRFGPKKFANLPTLVPGLLLCVTIGAAAGFLSEHYNGPIMLFALLLGMALTSLLDQGAAGPGVEFSARTILRAGVALLGFRITFADITALGVIPLFIIIGLTALTIGSALLIVKLFGRDWRFGILAGGAVAICGASAALAIAAVLPKDKELEQNTLLTVVAVTALSTLAMILYPALFQIWGFDDVTSGFLIGATIHDVAQVVGAGYSISDAAGETATLVKLMRVALLPVVIGILLLVMNRRPGGSVERLPAFLLFFVGFLLVNSFVDLPEILREALRQASQWMLVIAIAGLGLKTRLGALFSLGAGHMLTITLATAVLLGGALVATQALL